MERRRIETPNATMTTLASPAQGGAERLSTWEVEMSAGACGPVHVFDSEQIWSVLAGAVTITLDGRDHEVAAGAALVLPAGQERQISAAVDARLIVCGYGDALVSLPGEDAPRGTPEWIS